MRGYQVTWMLGLRRGGAKPGAWGTLDSCFPIRVTRVAKQAFRFRSKERGTRVKDRTKNGTSKRAGRGWGRKEGNKLACEQALLFGHAKRVSRELVMHVQSCCCSCFAH